MSQMMVAVQDEVHAGQDEAMGEAAAGPEMVFATGATQAGLDVGMAHEGVVVANGNEEVVQHVVSDENVVVSQESAVSDDGFVVNQEVVGGASATETGNVVETPDGTATVIVHEDVLQMKEGNCVKLEEQQHQQQVLMASDEHGNVIHLSESSGRVDMEQGQALTTVMGEQSSTGEGEPSYVMGAESSAAESDNSYVVGESEIVQFVQEEVVLSDTGNEVVNEVVVNGDDSDCVNGTQHPESQQVYHSSNDLMHVAEEEVVCTVPSTETEMSVAMDLANMSQGHFNPQPDFVAVDSATPTSKSTARRKSSGSKAKKTRVPPPVEEVDDGVVHEKPRMSYAQLIAEALMTREDRMLTLAEIYATISRKWPFYRMSQKTWQNAIRHNLTLNSAFQKIPRPNNEGRGNYWRMEEGSEKVIFKRAMKGGYLNKQKKTPQKQNVLTLSQQPLMIQTGGEFGGQAIVLGSGGSQTYQTIRIEKVPGNNAGTTTTTTAVGRPATIISGGSNQQQKVVLISLPSNVVRQEHAVK